LGNVTLNIENSKQVLSKAFKFSNDIICTIDNDGKFILVSDASYSILGFHPEELSGTSYIDYLCEEDKNKTSSEELSIKEGNATSTFENRYLHKNGKIVNLLWSSNWDDEEKIMYCVAKDVTEYKAILLKKEENETSLKEAHRFSKMGSWSFDFKNNHLKWSDSLYDVFRTDKSHFKETQESFLSFIAPEYKEFVDQNSKKSQITGEEFKINYKIITPNGEQCIIEEFGYSERDSNGKIIRLFGTSQDVTERIKIEQSLIDSNNKYKYLFENNPLPMFIYDFATLQIIDCNIEALLLYGYTREEFLNLTILDIRPEEDLTLIIEATKSNITYGEIHKKRWRHLNKKGELFFVDITGHLLEYENKKCSLVLVNDVTEKIALEKQQQEYIQFIETTLENLPVGIAVNKIDEGTATLMNHSFSDVYGWSKETLTNVSTFFEKVYPDSIYREEMIKRVSEDIASKDPKRMNWEGIKITTQNGEERVINAKNIPLYDQNLMISTVLDVTEKYRVTEDLKKSNERYGYATKATSDAIWDWNLLSDDFNWGENINLLFGFTFSINNSTSSSWFQMIHEEDYNLVCDSLTAILKSTKTNWNIEHRLIDGKGSIAIVNQKALIIRDETGKATRIVGAIQDITRRKKREQQLKLLESVITNTKDAVLITEAEPYDEPGPKILFVNDAFTNLTGYSKEEVIGKNPRILQGPNTDKEEIQKLSKAIRSWQACEITVINYDKSGNEFWSNFAISPVANEKGWFTHWISTQRDVTNEKIEIQKRELINEISTIFNKQNNLQNTLDALLKRISEIFNYPVMGMWLLDEDEDRLNLNSYSKNSVSKIDLRNFLENGIMHHYKEKGKGILGTVWETGKTVKWSINKKDFDLLLEKETIHAGIKKVTAIPILFNKCTIGTLLIAEEEEIIRYNDKIIISEEIGNHLGAEIKRKQLEQELSKIFNFAPDVVSLINKFGNFKRINPAGCDLFGYNESELLQMNITDLVHPKDYKEAKRKIHSLRLKEQTVYFENRFITKSGSILWMAWTSSSTKEGYIYSIGKDITERKESENQLKLLNNNLVEQSNKLHISNQELEQFAYVASHDLQEPLRMVTSFLTLIEKRYQDKLDAKGLQYINFAVEGAKNMRQIILDLLNFSRISNDSENYETIELSDIVKDVSLMQGKLIKEKNATINFKNLPKIISVRHYLIQLFQNIISNALKYSKYDTPLVIDVKSECTKSHYIISIKDNGIGIETEYFEKIFIIFQRLHAKDKYQGNGMGLAIAKKITDKLNGTIWVESKIGEGSTFYIKIPKIN
jgi:PAS domain S-box-containing protein